jgi:uncharacterized OB-fold protein
VGAHVSVPLYRRSLPQRLRLEGSRCADCGRVQFPPLPHCPACSGRRLAPHRLSGRGVVHAVTQVTAAGAPPEFADQGSFWVAIVALAEGPMITAQLTGLGGPPVIGQPVVAVVRRLYAEEGVIRYGFKFRPVEGE